MSVGEGRKSKWMEFVSCARGVVSSVACPARVERTVDACGRFLFLAVRLRGIERFPKGWVRPSPTLCDRPHSGSVRWPNFCYSEKCSNGNSSIAKIKILGVVARRSEKKFSQVGSRVDTPWLGGNATLGGFLGWPTLCPYPASRGASMVCGRVIRWRAVRNAGTSWRPRRSDTRTPTVAPSTICSESAEPGQQYRRE